MTLNTTIDPAEVAKFAAMAREWWDPEGKFAPLHKFNPVRLAYIRERAVAHFGRDAASLVPLGGLSLLDIGCGGGLLAEPMARIGAEVTGIDPSETNVMTALAHAAETGIAIDYRATSAEELAGTGARFDIVLNMEVVEHVADVRLFMAASAALVRPGGLLVVATINRTLKAFMLAIVGAEYVLGWLPRGTHRWDRFVRPEELDAALAGTGMAVRERVGVVYSPLADAWSRSRDTDVNYMVLAAKRAA
jgi:2-polyprenyl-6-hydroxyphenyl methylase/3-demethylubiquinone-9 3-methyltransferase